MKAITSIVGSRSARCNRIRALCARKLSLLNNYDLWHERIFFKIINISCLFLALLYILYFGKRVFNQGGEGSYIFLSFILRVLFLFYVLIFLLSLLDRNTWNHLTLCKQMSFGWIQNYDCVWLYLMAYQFL